MATPKVAATERAAKYGPPKNPYAQPERMPKGRGRPAAPHRRGHRDEIAAALGKSTMEKMPEMIVAPKAKKPAPKPAAPKTTKKPSASAVGQSIGMPKAPKYPMPKGPVTPKRRRRRAPMAAIKGGARRHL